MPSASEARAWIKENFPESLKTKLEEYFQSMPRYPDGPDWKLWKERVAAQGLGHADLAQGLWRRRPADGAGARRCSRNLNMGACNPMGGMGTMMFGPTLLEYGSEEQKKRHLPASSRGEVRWCQGYSEPGAGSDLAVAADQGRGQGRPLSGQRPEDLDLAAPVRRLVLLPGAHRHQCEEARGHLLPADRHEDAGRRGAADQADLAATRRSARPSSPT